MSIVITHHALKYIARGHMSRTRLTTIEIEKLIDTNSFVRLGSDSNGQFDLVWDHHGSEGVVLVTAPGWFEGETKVVSVWKSYFQSLGTRRPSPFELERAKEKSEELWSRAAT